MSEIKRFEDLKVWQKSHELALEVYRVTQQFPNEEKFGLTSQIRRSAVSVAANIAEGSKRRHLKEYIQMLYIPHGSLSETEYYLFLARDLKYLSDAKYQELFNLSEEVGRMLNGLVKSLSSNLITQTSNLKRLSNNYQTTNR
ncbi:hypothetical protein C5S32_03215 [ANME-1 cluster archaeon GoMg1]|nr:hypothetical protein [ANME-1 cluster archaeon GoMg1]